MTVICQFAADYFSNNNGMWTLAADFDAYGSVATVIVSGPQMQKNYGGMCSMLAGDPINVGTGNLFETQTDFTAAPETQLSFTRYYNSADTSNAGLGVGWHSTYHRGLSVSGSAVTVTRADGRQDTYTQSGSSYVSDSDVTNVLTPIPAAGTQTVWQLKLSDDSTEKYDLAGHLLSITTRAGLTTTLTYNASGQLSTVTGPFGHKLSFTYDASNRVNTMTVPDGGRFTYGYDTHCNLISVLHPDNTIRQYLYQNSTFPDFLTGLIDESGNLFESWTYDSLGRATSSQHAGGADLTTVAYTNGTSSTVTDARGNTHTYTLTTQYNLVKPTAISGVGCGCSSGAKAYTYDGNGFISSLTDFDGNVTTYVHNAQGEETSRTEAYGTPLARTITTTTWLTAFHLPTQIVEPNGTTTFSYDANGNLLVKSVSDGTHTRTWTYTYNSFGQVLTAKDPNGHITTTTYDAKGDVATMRNALGQLTSFTGYDADGKLLGTTDPNGLVTAFTYDLLGRVVTKKVGTLTTSYAYTPFGMLSLVTEPDRSFYKRIYDAAHRLTQITDAAGDSIDYAYDATSNLASVNIYDPTNTLTYTHGYTYDADNRLASETGALAGETTTYTYDNQGNLLTRTDPLGHVTAYGYDALNRRISVLDALHNQTVYSYNDNDDLTAIVDPRSLATLYTYDGLDDQTGVTSPDTGTTMRTFDAAGNLLTSTDARGRMASATAGVTTNYAINAFGERIRKSGSGVPNGGANEYAYDEQGDLIGEYNSAGAIVNETVYLGDTPVAVLSGTGGAAVYSVSADWLNAPHIIQDAGKQAVWTWDHYAFGDNAPNQNPAGLGTFNYNLRFPGQHYDAKSGLDYNIARDYNAQLGRYIESDPIGLQAGINTYGYVGGNPLTWFDPDGLEPQKGGRGDTGGSSGKQTDNPYKHCWQDPCDPNKIICRDNHTGKKISKPKPPDWDQYKFSSPEEISPSPSLPAPAPTPVPLPQPSPWYSPPSWLAPLGLGGTFVWWTWVLLPKPL